MTSCCGQGPGYASPADAVKGPREKILYVCCLQPDGQEKKKPDYLAVVDVDPESPRYCQVISRGHAKTFGDEFHHMNWNTCSSCFGDPKCRRDKMILPCLASNRIYIFDLSDEREPKLFKVIEDISKKYDVSAPHTGHCLPSGQVMISCIGNAQGQAKGSFVLLDAKTFELQGLWDKKPASFGYDFWYQLRHDVMVSTEWAEPLKWKKGFWPMDVKEGKYGRGLNFWSWKDRTITQHLDLGETGRQPFEIRFLHDPQRTVGFVCCVLTGAIFMFDKNENNNWTAEQVIQIPSLNVSHWLMPVMPAMTTDILVSMDDKYLYLSNWAHGDVRQYDITDPRKPRLTGQVFLGGSCCSDTYVRIVREDNVDRPERPVVKGTPLRGGPQMHQLSLDGKRLYVTNSLYSVWDKQFYPEMYEKGSHMVQLDIDHENGGMTLNPNFFVDFGKEPDGPVLAHEMRYPGGDCTSDIFP